MQAGCFFTLSAISVKRPSTLGCLMMELTDNLVEYQVVHSGNKATLILVYVEKEVARDGSGGDSTLVTYLPVAGPHPTPRPSH